MLCKNEESLHTGQITLQCCVKTRRTMTATWLMFRYITSTIQHSSLTLSVAPLFSLSPYPIFTTCTMPDYRDEDHEGYVPWWDRTPTGSSSSDETETESKSEAYSSDKELFYNYEYAYEEAMEHYLNAYAFFFDAFDTDDEDEDEDDDSSSSPYSDDDNDDDDGAEQPSKRGRRQ